MNKVKYFEDLVDKLDTEDMHTLDKDGKPTLVGADSAVADVTTLKGGPQVLSITRLTRKTPDAAPKMTTIYIVP